jgi:ureidoacrylate peracid hydrolase
MCLAPAILFCNPGKGKKGIHLKGRYYRFVTPAGNAEEDVFLDPERTAFMLIDVYGLFSDDPGYKNLPEFYRSPPQAEKRRKAMFKKILLAKKAAKALKLPVIYLQNHLAPSTNENTEWRIMSLRTCGVDVLKTWQEPNAILAFSKMIAPGPGETVIKKQMYSGFFETDLHSLLESLDVKNLVVAGFDANICLRTTVTDAMYRGYRVVLLRDCTRTSEFPDTKKGNYANRLAIRFVEANVGYTSTSDAFVRACRKLRP